MLSTLDFKRLVVPLKTDFGDMSIHIVLREDPKAMPYSASNGKIVAQDRFNT